MDRIGFTRLLDISNDWDLILPEEELILKTYHTVYAIINDKLNMIYIGETDDTFIRLFLFWKEDKRHVTGSMAPINKLFNGDYENTYFVLLEKDCDNRTREYYWHDYYRDNTDYIIVSLPGRHGCTNPGNKGMIAINKGNRQTYINPLDLEKFEKLGWTKGGKKNRPRTEEQKKRISEAHIGQKAWNSGRTFTEEERKQLFYKKRGIFLTPSGETVESAIHAAKRYHKDWKLLNEITER